MRLFVAVDIDDRTRAQLALSRESIESVINNARVPPRVTWVKDESAHVTLRFIGEVPEAAVAPIAQALSKKFEVPPFDVEWRRLGTFPQGNNPRVIWVGAATDADLARLADEVNARLLALIGPGESRPFRAHVTLGRVKEPGKGTDWRQAVDGSPWQPTVTRVDHLTLYSSRTSPKGPTYTALARASL